MTQLIDALKPFVDLGVAGLIIFVAWKLLDAWAGRFLEVQNKQATAMGELAAAVREGQGEGREMLLAVRVLASKVDEVKEWVRELDEHVRANGARE